MSKINPSETLITGTWLIKDGISAADDTCQRIAELVKFHLIELGKDFSGWDTLYRDPTDGRLWELIYPQSELHGGGPPQLRYLSTDEAKRKYGNVGI